MSWPPTLQNIFPFHQLIGTSNKDGALRSIRHGFSLLNFFPRHAPST